MGAGSRRGQTPYEQHRDRVLLTLARQCPWLDPAEREAAYHDAYLTYLEKERDRSLDTSIMRPPQVLAWLIQAAIRNCLQARRRAYHRHAVPLEEAALNTADPSEDVEGRGLERIAGAPVRELVERLPERQKAIVKLRFYLGLERAEIERLLGISPRVYRREVERAFEQVAKGYEAVRAGRWCESRRSLVLAYLAGVAGPHRAAEARLHLSSCPACTQMAAQLREGTERIAALLPMPDAATHHGPLSRAAEVLTAAKHQVAELAAGAKQHAAAAAGRLDPGAPQYAAAARPGAVATVVAGCIALGGGATYCAVQGLRGPLPGSEHHRAATTTHHRAEPRAPTRDEGAMPPGIAEPLRRPVSKPRPSPVKPESPPVVKPDVAPPQSAPAPAPPPAPVGAPSAPAAPPLPGQGVRPVGGRRGPAAGAVLAKLERRRRIGHPLVGLGRGRLGRVRAVARSPLIGSPLARSPPSCTTST